MLSLFVSLPSKVSVPCQPVSWAATGLEFPRIRRGETTTRAFAGVRHSAAIKKLKSMFVTNSRDPIQYACQALPTELSSRLVDRIWNSSAAMSPILSVNPDRTKRKKITRYNRSDSRFQSRWWCWWWIYRIPQGWQNSVVVIPTNGANDEVVSSSMSKVMDLAFRERR
jgi:hypothetical protein